jgi:hypothetical protein
MKKVKVMLAGIAILAVIGGTFAFKAKNTFGSTVYTTNVQPQTGVNACSVENSNFTTQLTQPIGSTEAAVYYTVALAPADCAGTSLVYTIGASGN